jgi:superfamily II DNA or RNA helicase
MILRDYQEDTVTQNLSAMDRGVKSTLNHLFTGAGKTVCFATMASRISGRTLIMCHLRPLVWQTVDKIREICDLDPGVEMADYASDENDWFPSKVVVASKPTLTSKRGGEYRYKRFTDMSLVIVDEAHLMCSPAVVEMLRWFQDTGAMIAGFTATPFRMDGKPMLRRAACSSMKSLSEGTTSTGPSPTDGQSPLSANSPESKDLTCPW